MAGKHDQTDGERAARLDWLRVRVALHLAYRVGMPRAHKDVEEAVEEAMVAVYAADYLALPDNQLLAIGFRIARNKFVDIQRRGAAFNQRAGEIAERYGLLAHKGDPLAAAVAGEARCLLRSLPEALEACLPADASERQFLKDYLDSLIRGAPQSLRSLSLKYWPNHDATKSARVWAPFLRRLRSYLKSGSQPTSPQPAPTRGGPASQAVADPKPE